MCNRHVCVCVCVCLHECMCMHAYECVCECVCPCVHAMSAEFFILNTLIHLLIQNHCFYEEMGATHSLS